MNLITVPFERLTWPMTFSRPENDTRINIEDIHLPVLMEEVLNFLLPRPGGFYLDATLGIGGHTAAILKHSSPSGSVLGLDQDRNALSLAAQRLSPYSGRFQLAQANFSELKQVVEQRQLGGFDGALFDLGVSSLQLDVAERGFSFLREGPLDMRMDQERVLTAHEVVNCYSEKDLANLIFQYGEEPMARRIARSIVRARPIKNTCVLAELVVRSMPYKKPSRVHPATRTFQALRIFVNDELGSLSKGLRAAVEMLNPGGRIVVLSFHSLEDGMVKETFRVLSRACQCPPVWGGCHCGNQKLLKVLTKSPITASEEEIKMNSRSRSVKLRAAEKL
jgi:16S rRNA (cytosine1402-N4)-methyltransferase